MTSKEDAGNEVRQTWVNLSRFLDSRLRCTSAMSLSRQADRWACRSRGCAATILSRSAVYICRHRAKIH